MNHLASVLPPELLIQLLTLLDRRSLLELRLASSFLDRNILTLLWNHPLIPRFPSSPIEPLLERHGHLVRHLEFPDPTDIDLRKVAPYLSNLRSIDFSGITAFRIKDGEVNAILINCPKLLSINLNDCVDITDKALETLRNHPNISMMNCLKFNRCCELTEAGLCALLASAEQLQRLSLNLVPLAGQSVIETIARSCPLLEELEIAENDWVMDSGLTLLAASNLRLKALDLSECFNVSEEGLMAFSASRQSLRVDGLTLLKLNGCEAATSKAVISLLPTPHPSTLLKSAGNFALELSSTQGFSHLTLDHLSTFPNCFGQLTLNQTTIDISLHPAERITLSANSFFGKQTRITSLFLSGGLNGCIDDNVCLTISKSLPLLKVLDLSDSQHLTDAGIGAIAEHCLQLEDLNVKGCVNLTDASVEALMAKRDSTDVRLRFLNVGLCRHLTDASAIFLSKLCMREPGADAASGMHTLKFSGCTQISDKAILALASAIDPDTTDVAAAAAARRHGSLQLLCLSGCVQVSGQILSNLLPLLPMLESINVFSCSSFDDHALETLASSCPQLQSLVIARCPVGDAGILQLAKHSRKLHTLYMGFLISGRGCPAGDKGISAVLGSCRELKLLDVSRCEGLTDEAFGDAALCGGGGEEFSLQVLIARACFQITARGLQGFVRLCPRLQTLDVMGCVRISAAERNGLREMLEQ
ncbi:Transcription factor COE1 [Phlyctochytrium planicorne]|nr:Transcription factor COE1 [Phlyctochytrium planicorne]